MARGSGEYARVPYQPHCEPAGFGLATGPDPEPRLESGRDEAVGRGATKVRLMFDDFGWRSLEAAAASGGEDLAGFARRALADFAAAKRASRFVVLSPRFKTVGRGSRANSRSNSPSPSWRDCSPTPIAKGSPSSA